MPSARPRGSSSSGTESIRPRPAIGFSRNAPGPPWALRRRCWRCLEPRGADDQLSQLGIQLASLQPQLRDLLIGPILRLESIFQPLNGFLRRFEAAKVDSLLAAEQ